MNYTSILYAVHCLLILDLLLIYYPANHDSFFDQEITSATIKFSLSTQVPYRQAFDLISPVPDVTPVIVELTMIVELDAVIDAGTVPVVTIVVAVDGV